MESRYILSLSLKRVPSLPLTTATVAAGQSLLCQSGLEQMEGLCASDMSGKKGKYSSLTDRPHLQTNE